MSPYTVNENGTHEQDRLLNSHVAEDDAIPENLKIPSRATLLRRNVKILCFVLLIIFEVGIYLQVTPMSKILEDVICRGYYPELSVTSAGRVEDPRCKSADVQSELAVLRGWTATFDLVPGKSLADSQANRRVGL